MSQGEVASATIARANRILDDWNARHYRQLGFFCFFDDGADLARQIRRARHLAAIAETPRLRRLWCRLAGMSELQDWATLAELYRIRHGELVAAARRHVAIRQGKPTRPASHPRGQRRDRITAIKQRLDILTFAERFTALRRSGREYVGRCPTHEDRSPSFYVNPERQVWYCFSCNRGGDVINLAAALREVSRW